MQTHEIITFLIVIAVGVGGLFLSKVKVKTTASQVFAAALLSVLFGYIVIGLNRAALKKAQGTVTGTRLTTTINKLKESAHELKERNKELNDFVSIGAHEIRAPLMPILGIAEILELESEETSGEEISIRKDQVESIIRNSQRLAKIASEILDVTTISSQKKRI